MSCMSGEVEDEKHFLLHCTVYEHLRQKMYQDIKMETSGMWRLEDMNPEEKWEILLRGTRDRREKKVFEQVKLFVYKANKLRDMI